MNAFGLLIMSYPSPFANPFSQLIFFLNINSHLFTPLSYLSQVWLLPKSCLIRCSTSNCFGRSMVHQPGNMLCHLTPQELWKTTCIEQHLYAFNNGSVLAFRNTILLGSIVHDKLLLHAFGIEIEDEFLDEFLPQVFSPSI